MKKTKKNKIQFLFYFIFYFHYLFYYTILLYFIIPPYYDTILQHLLVKIPYRNPHQLTQDSTLALYPACFVSSTCSCCTGSVGLPPQSYP